MNKRTKRLTKSEAWRELAESFRNLAMGVSSHYTIGGLCLSIRELRDRRRISTATAQAMMDTITLTLIPGLHRTDTSYFFPIGPDYALARAWLCERFANYAGEANDRWYYRQQLMAALAMLDTKKVRS